MKKILLLFVILLIGCYEVDHEEPQSEQQITQQESSQPESPQPEHLCTDSDDGKIYDIQGTVKTDDKSESDICSSEFILLERYCDSDQLKTEQYDCSQEKGICNEGRCVPDPYLRIPSSTTSFYFDAESNTLDSNYFGEYDLQIRRGASYYVFNSYNHNKLSAQISDSFDSITKEKCQSITYTTSVSLKQDKSICVKTQEGAFLVIGLEFDGKTTGKDIRWKLFS